MRSGAGLGRRAAIALATAGAIAAGSLAWAHVRLIHPGNGFELRWLAPTSISIVINATGSGDVPDGSHIPALQNAIRAWNEASGSAARLVENTSPGQRARTDWQNDDLHLLYFDENDSSGYFPLGTGIVAITPVWFTGSGAISDSDVLFNGQDFDFTTSGVNGCFDIQDVATHELGHLLSLDHSGWAGATMYPYVDTTIVLHRSLAQDEVCGLRDAYPATAFANLTGVVRRSNDSYVVGAHVVARGADGRPYGADLTTNLGAFRIHGLPAGDYSLYATPLDMPVSVGNLSSGHTVQTDFQSTQLGTVTVPGTSDVSVGNKTVLSDTTLSLGRSSDVFPVRCISGATRTVTMRGTALSAGSTLVASDPSITVNVLTWGTSLVTFQVVVSAGEAPGHVDLTVTNAAGARHTLVAGLEITPPSPLVAAVSPPEGSIHGGTALAITGSDFRPGARVVIGLRTYVDGLPGGCTVESASTIRLTTAPEAAGTYSVVVTDVTGVEGRASAAYRFGAQPSIDSVFPLAGSAAGGTSLVLRGTDFVPGCNVTIDGVVQTSVTFASASKITVTTSPGVPGGPYALEVTNPGGESATALFSYATGPDPLIDELVPSNGSAEGGDVVLVHGANFTGTTTVLFGADGDTGSGGAPAPQIEFLDAGTLRVTTPAVSGGRRNVVVLDTSSNQGAVALSAFTFESSGGGGGGCGSVIVPDEPLLRGMSGWLSVACAFAWLVFRSRRNASSPA